jgi:hypothetical protein
MNKRFMILIAAMLLAIGSSAQARDYFGIRFGFPELGLQLGSTTAFSRNLGGRLTVDFGYRNNSFIIGGDILYTIIIPTPNTRLDLEFYLGGGLGVGFAPNVVDYNLHFVLGLEFLLTRQIGIFIEGRPVGYSSLGYYYGGALGINFRL